MDHRSRLSRCLQQRTDVVFFYHKASHKIKHAKLISVVLTIQAHPPLTIRGRVAAASRIGVPASYPSPSQSSVRGRQEEWEYHGGVSV